jgi:hypothetical protein
MFVSDWETLPVSSHALEHHPSLLHHSGDSKCIEQDVISFVAWPTR